MAATEHVVSPRLPHVVPYTCWPCRTPYMLRYVNFTLIVVSIFLASPYFAFQCIDSRWETVSRLCLSMVCVSGWRRPGCGGHQREGHGAAEQGARPRTALHRCRTLTVTVGDRL